MKVKFLVDKIGEDSKFGTTTTPLYFYGNINKVVGLWDTIKSEIDSLPKNSSLNNVLPMYNFIGCILLNNHDKNVRMILFDAENNEDKAKEIAARFEKRDKQMAEGIMNVFYQIRNQYDFLEGKAELSLIKTD